LELAMATARNQSTGAFDLVGAVAQNALAALGDWAIFAARTLSWMFGRRPCRGTLVPNFYFVGVRSVPVVAITGMFIGMVLAVQSYSQFYQLGLASRLGSIINLSLVRELGPVLAATMLAGRVGSAMAAELATMRVTEQIDALSCLGVNPVHYLVVPRFLACVLLIPLLTIMANFMGVMGAALISTRVYGVDAHHYWMHAGNHIGLFDIFTGLLKPMFFGAAIALISCHRGFRSSGGAEGVGRAATEAFVLSFISILALDFFLGMFLNTLYDRLWPFAGIQFG
jgi:phospholipid/cholesterol/gamma-HCH transport system permease protein